eukprot:10532947-Ditylum_brightwellii.AAC.1
MIPSRTGEAVSVTVVSGAYRGAICLKPSDMRLMEIFLSYLRSNIGPVGSVESNVKSIDVISC